jgi:hypothetical protein
MLLSGNFKEQNRAHIKQLAGLPTTEVDVQRELENRIWELLSWVNKIKY